MNLPGTPKGLGVLLKSRALYLLLMILKRGSRSVRYLLYFFFYALSQHPLVAFPQQAVAFHYYGIPRSNGGLYGICIDCDPNDMRFETVDALDQSDNGQNPPVRYRCLSREP